MTVATLKRQGLINGSRSRHVQDYTPWQRPSDWPALPPAVPNEQKIAALFAVFDHDDNRCRFQIQGNYTVDWGDGVVEPLTSNTISNHVYDFNDPDLGAVTSEGFKVAVIIITPTAAASLTLLDFATNGAAGNPAYATGWLEMRVSAPNVTGMSLGGGPKQSHRLLRHFEWASAPPTFNITTVGFFSGCNALEDVSSGGWTVNQTNFTNWFSGCQSLRRIPLLDTRNVTNFGNCFNGCFSLEEVPLLDTSKATLASGMFSNCSSLRTVPLFDLSKVTTIAQMFSGCTLLESVPAFNLALCGAINSAFSGCSRLKSVGLMNTPLVTAFGNCFQNCVMLTTIPLLNTAAATGVASMFSGCTSLQTLPALDFSSVTSAPTTVFGTCTSLSKSDVRGLKLSHSYASCRLSGPELDRIYTNLPSGVSAQTITVTGNYGVATDNPGTATAKGWTVTGS
jgi:hypothetical protein